MKKWFITVLIICMPLLATAQLSTVFEEETDAIILSAGLETGKEIAGFSCQAIWSINTLFDIEARYVRTNFNTDNQYTYDGYIDGFSGIVTWWMLKKNINRSLSVDLGLKAGIESNNYSMYSYWVDDDTFVEMNGYSGGKVGLDAVLNYWITDYSLLRPSLIVYGEAGLSSRTVSGMAVQSGYFGTTACAGVSYVKRLNLKDAFYVYPSVLLNTYNMPIRYTITVGYLIAF